MITSITIKALRVLMTSTINSAKIGSKMILSTVNLVNNYKFSDFIITKITEEQKEIDIESLKRNKRHSLGAPSKRDSDTACSRKRASLRDRRSPDVVGHTENGACASIPSGDYVSIATDDGYMLSADFSMCHVRLCHQTTVSANNVFRRVKIEEGCTNHEQLYVFQLYNNSSYYLATSPDMGLQIQSYCEDTLDLALPDERMFLCHEHSNGASIIHPLLQTGLYLHHRDDRVSLRQFDLNLRPPEEYFIYMNQVPAQKLTEIQLATSLVLHTPKVKPDPMETDTSHPLKPETTKDGSKSFWRLKSKKKDKTKHSPITPQQGPLSCFPTPKKKKSKKFWR